MGLLLSGILKDQKWSLGAHFISKPLFERTRGEKGGGERLGFAKRSGFGWICFSFLPPKGSSNLQEEI